MSYQSTIAEVLEVFRELDEHIATTTASAGLKCPEFCSLCCKKSDIEASMLEFLPLAAYLYENGLVDEYLLKIEQAKDGLCVCYDVKASERSKWGCQQYLNRGLICRLFGYGFRLNRDNIPTLVTCKTMKSFVPAAIEITAGMAIQQPDEMPIFHHYFMKLYSIEPEMALQKMPINEAIRTAIEKLYFYYRI